MKELTIIVIRSSVISADITLILSVPSLRIPEALITLTPSAFLYAEPTAILTLVRPSLYHVLCTGLLSFLVDLSAFIRLSLESDTYKPSG